jgi:hypothetical protein
MDLSALFDIIQRVSHFRSPNESSARQRPFWDNQGFNCKLFVNNILQVRSRAPDSIYVVLVRAFFTHWLRVDTYFVPAEAGFCIFTDCKWPIHLKSSFPRSSPRAQTVAVTSSSAGFWASETHANWALCLRSVSILANPSPTEDCQTRWGVSLQAIFQNHPQSG